MGGQFELYDYLLQNPNIAFNRIELAKVLDVNPNSINNSMNKLSGLKGIILGIAKYKTINGTKECKTIMFKKNKVKK